MARKVNVVPSEKELEILAQVWKFGRCTVRQVYEGQLRQKKAYTTILKQMQIMHAKGLLARGVSGRKHIYSPCVTAQEVRCLLAKRIKTWTSSVGRFSFEELAGSLGKPGE